MLSLDRMVDSGMENLEDLLRLDIVLDGRPHTLEMGPEPEHLVKETLRHDVTGNDEPIGMMADYPQ